MKEVMLRIDVECSVRSEYVSERMSLDLHPLAWDTTHILRGT
jgi:hypothetical protein